MKLAIWTDIYNELQPEEAVARLLAGSFRYFDFGSTHFEMWLRGGRKERQISELKRLLTAAGGGFVQMHAPIFNFLEDERAEEKLEMCEEALALAAEMEIDWVVIHPGSKAGWEKDPELTEWVRERNLKVYQRLLRTAENVGTGIAVENLICSASRGRMFGAYAAELKWLLDQLASPRVGICWDTGHANLTHHGRTAEQLEALNLIKERVVAAHIADNRGAEDEHLFPYRGDINWPEVMRVLTGLPVAFNFEVPGERAGSPLKVRDVLVEYGYRLGSYMLEGQ